MIKRLVLLSLCVLGFVSIQGDVHGQDLEPDRANSLVWSPAGDKVAVGYEDGTIQIWDAATTQLISTFQDSEGYLGRISWSPDGNRLLSVIISSECAIHIWNVETGQIEVTLDPPDNGICVGKATWSPDGTQILGTASEGHPSVYLWDATTGQILETRNAGVVNRLTWSPNTNRIVFTTPMGFTSIWDDQTLEEVTRLGTWDAGVSTSIFDWAIPAEWSPDGAQLITGHGDGHVRVWDVATEQVLLDLVANEYPLEETSDSTALFTKGVEDVGFTSDGRFLQAISRDGTVRQWDSVTGDLLDSYQLQDISYPLFAAAFSPDETQIAYAGDANSIHIIEPFPAR